ncbi:MAG: hypothetical protein EHM23_01415 [Acidobacteria bacterium]|nr:MAG: hypothetical protein EHM23_22970 [Acidobacteriota bacterium]RPJ63791.1 MAG: hypothetical protein EHM23_01415 [Acidobacteriota bacterium]
MFEQIRQTDKPDRSLLWKVIPAALILFAIIVGLVILFAFDKPSESAPLTGVLRAGDPNFEWYKKYLSIDHESQKIQMGTNYAGDRVVMFAGTINNGGEKTLDVVEVKLVLFNYEKPVWETVRIPIRPDSRIEPIPPLGRRSFALYVETLPEAWNAGQAEMWISGFRFVQ